jgi:hypothetical protein
VSGAGARPTVGPGRARRRAGAVLAIVFFGFQAGVWLWQFRRTSRRSGWDVDLTPPTALEARRIGDIVGTESGPVLCITSRPTSIAFLTWQRLLYPLRLIDITPASAILAMAARGTHPRRGRFVLSFGYDAPPLDPGFDRRIWIAPDVLLGEWPR